MITQGGDGQTKSATDPRSAYRLIPAFRFRKTSIRPLCIRNSALGRGAIGGAKPSLRGGPGETIIESAESNVTEALKQDAREWGLATAPSADSDGHDSDETSRFGETQEETGYHLAPVTRLALFEISRRMLKR
jgi:hypothetical protein